MLHHHFLNAGANGIIEKLFISIMEFQRNMLSALLELIFPIPMSGIREIMYQYRMIYIKYW